MRSSFVEVSSTTAVATVEPEHTDAIPGGGRKVMLKTKSVQHSEAASLASAFFNYRIPYTGVRSLPVLLVFIACAEIDAAHPACLGFLTHLRYRNGRAGNHKPGQHRKRLRSV